MSFEQHLIQAFTVQRDTSDILTETAILASLTVTYQPSKTCHMNVNISEASVFDQVLITGTDDNDAVLTELFTFTKNTVKPGKELFKSITGITTSGFTGGNINIKGKQRSGESLDVRRDIKTIKARVYDPDTSYSTNIPGAVQSKTSRIMIHKNDSGLLKGDYLVGADDFSYQLSTSLQPRRGSPGVDIHHYEADVEQIES